MWYKYKALDTNKNLITDYLLSKNYKNMSDACLFLEKEGYDIFSIEKVNLIFIIN